MREGEVYKRKGVYRERGRKKRYGEEMRRTLGEKRVNTNISYVNVASSGQVVLKKVVHPFKRISLLFLIFLLRQSPPFVACFPLL